MPRLPDPTDFGARPSLRTDRVDPVYPEGIDVAESITVAAQVFAQAYGEKKQKDSRINYALAKNEILAMDLRLRQGFKERQDFENFDESYTTDFIAQGNDILTRHNRLTAEDSALLQSEINLIRERGRADVAGVARGIEVDLIRAETTTSLAQFAEMVHLSETQDDRNEYILQGLETVKAAEENGAYTEQEAEELNHTFATTIATNSLANMDPEERLDEIRLALLWREARGSHLSAEDAAKGEGSGSIGDYLSVAALRAMETATEKELETDTYMQLGQDASDEAWAQFPGLEQGTERDRYIRERTQGNPQARTEGLLRSSQRLAREEKSETLRETQTYEQIYNDIMATDGSAPQSDLFSSLPPSLQESLNAVRKLELEGKDWAFSTDWEAREAWDNLTDAEKARTIFHTDPPEHQQQILEQQGWTEEMINSAGLWTDNYGEQHAWRATVAADRAGYMLADRAQAIARLRAGGSLDHVGSLSQEQLLERALVNTPYFERKPTADDDEEVRAEWMRISDEYNRQLVELHRQGVEIDDTKRYEVLGNIIIKDVQVRRGGFDDEMLYAAMSPADYPEGYIPIDKSIVIAPGEAPVMLATVSMRIPAHLGGSPTGEKESVYHWIRNRIASENNEPVDEIDNDEIEEVWFYAVTQGWDAADARIRRAYGY